MLILIWLHSSVWDEVLIKDVVLSSKLIMPLQGKCTLIEFMEPFYQGILQQLNADKVEIPPTVRDLFMNFLTQRQGYDILHFFHNCRVLHLSSDHYRRVKIGNCKEEGKERERKHNNQANTRNNYREMKFQTLCRATEVFYGKQGVLPEVETYPHQRKNRRNSTKKKLR